MKRIFNIALLSAVVLAGCNDDYIDKFDGDVDEDFSSATSGQYTLTSSDYSSIASNSTNKALAEAAGLSDELASVGTNKYFNDYISADEYLPAFLKEQFYDYELGSTVTVTYNQYKEPSAYLSDFSSFSSYTLTSDDYASVWTGAVSASYLTPETESNIATILSSAVSNPSEGDAVVVNYAYDDVEPAQTETGSTVSYDTVYVATTSFDGAGRYLIASNYNGVYYPWGRLSSDTNTYGYMYGPAREANEDGNLEHLAGYVIEVEESTNGYTLKNAIDQYVYMSGSYNSFNVTTDVPTSGGEWTFSANSDGTFDIMNVAKEKTIMYGTSYSSFGAYPSSTYIYYSNTLLSSTAPDGFTFPVTSVDEAFTSDIWTCTSNYGLKATAYSSSTNYASEAWAITPAITIGSSGSAYVTMDIAGRYFSSSEGFDGSFGVYVSTDYTESDASSATWTQLVIDDENKTAGSNWNFVNTGNLSLTDYKGQTIYIGLKYTSTADAAATVEVKNLYVGNSAYVAPNLFKEELTESGNKAESTVLANKSAVYRYDGSAWVEYSTDDARLDVVQPETYEVLGSETIDNEDTFFPTYLAQQFPYAEDGASVAVIYNTSSGYTIAEFTYTSGAWAESADYTVETMDFSLDADGFNANMSVYQNSTLLNGDDGNFTAYDVLLPAGFSYVWSLTDSYGWKGSAYKSGNYEADSWLVSSAINLKKATAPYLSFDEVYRYVDASLVAEYLTVNISTDFSGDVSKATWTQLTIQEWSSGSDWTFVNSGNIDLSEYVGNKVYIGFRYTSTTSYAPTWEIKNFLVREPEEE